MRARVSRTPVARLFARVLVMPAPPGVGLGLRPTFRRIFPRFLPAERRQVEEGPDAAQRLDAALGREVGAIDPLAAVAQKHAQSVFLALVRRHAEVAVEVAR